MTDFTMLPRRDALKALLAISASGALAACKGGDAQKRFEATMEASRLTASDMTFLSAIAQTIIPKTDTAGAIEAGVPQTLAGLFKDWGDDNYRIYWKTGVTDLQDYFQKEGGQVFADMSQAQQADILGKYDAKAFADGDFGGFYKDMKSTIATAYYMSEPGATEELVYEPVPGEWKGCVPLSDQPKTWAT